MRMNVLHSLCLPLVLVASLTLTLTAQAQYKYAEPGKSVTYSDQPPPANAKVLKLSTDTSSSSSNAPLPFDLQQAVQNFPVVLYTMPNCAACDEGRNYLRNRGIPYSEKSVKTNEDIDVIKRYSSDNTLPVLLVGKRKGVGFSSASWGDMLSDAGYPPTSKLPRNYQFAEAESAAPAKSSAAPVTSSTPTSSAGEPGKRLINPRSPTQSAPSGAPANSQPSATPPGFRF